MASILGPDGRPLTAPVPFDPGPRAQLGPWNNNWWVWTQTFMQVFRNPDDLSVTDYEKMVTTDETVYSGIEFITLAALARLGEYTHEDKKMEDFVRENLASMQGTFADVVAEILSAVWAGFSVTEILYRMDGNRVMLKGLQGLHPRTIDMDIFKEGPEKNELRCIYQWLWQTYQVTLPVDKCIIFSHRQRFGNIYGQSRLRPAYKNWFLKDLMLKAWGLTLERYGSPIAKAHVPAGNVPIDSTGMTAFQYVGSVLDNLSGRGSLVFDDRTQVDLMYAPRGFGRDFNEVIEYCNLMISRALLLPSLVASHGSGHGSYSLGQKHFDMFFLALENLLHQVINVLIEQLVRRLIEVNFGPRADGDYGDFSVEQFEPDEEKLMSEVFINLVNCGALDPHRLDDLNLMRERIGIPAVEEEDLAPLTPETPPPTEPGQPDAPPPDAVTPPEAKIQQPIPQMAKFSTSLQGRRRQRMRRSVLRTDI